MVQPVSIDEFEVEVPSPQEGLGHNVDDYEDFSVVEYGFDVDLETGTMIRRSGNLLGKLKHFNVLVLN